jgi:hypothetical protein
MNHASNRTFIDYYRPRRHAGLQEIMCGLKPDEVFAQALTRMSRWIDKRRPRHLTDTEKAPVEQHPELQAAIRIQEDLAALYARTREPALVPLLQERKREVTNTRRRLLYQLKHKLRQEFSRDQAVIDIERQLSGSAVEDEGAREVLRTEFEMPPAQIHLLAKLLTWPTSDSLEDEWRRRNEGVEAVRQYCDFLEGGPLRGRPKRTLPRDDAFREDNPPEKKIKQEVHPSIPPVEENNGPAQGRLACFQCGKMYTEHGSVIRHFRMAHLKDRRCISCDLQLQNEMHLRRHAAEVHCVNTRPPIY